MKVYILLPIISVLTSCATKTKNFEKLPCEPNEDKDYKIFKPCREYVFIAKYWDSEFNLVSQEKIWMMATGKP